MTIVLELRGVWKSYPGPDGGEPVHVLRGVDWRVEEGDTAAIVGPSGSGKSTLLNIAGAMDRPTAGEVALAGIELAGLDEDGLTRARRRTVGFVFQDHLLLPQLTALENVLLPALAERGEPLPERRARQLLERVGLGARLHHRPAELSGGERQRVAVARALIRSPRLLLADEPTGSLDAPTAAALADLLVELNREENVALVVATHAPALAARLRRRWTLVEGRLVEAAAPPP